MCVCIGVSEFGHTCVYKTYQQAHQYSAPRLQSLPDLLIISILLHPNSEEIQYLEVPHESLTMGQAQFSLALAWQPCWRAHSAAAQKQKKIQSLKHISYSEVQD